MGSEGISVVSSTLYVGVVSFQMSFAPAKNFAPAKKEEEKEVETDPAAATAHDDDDLSLSLSRESV